MCLMGLLINVNGCGLIQGCDDRVWHPVGFSDTNQSTFSLSRRNIFGKRIPFCVQLWLHVSSG